MDGRSGWRLGGPARLLVVFGLVSLVTVGLGAWVCAASGVPAGSWVRNLVAWGVGAVLAAGLAFAGGRPISLAIALAAAPIGLAATFLNPDQQDVHRWIDAGPLHVNVAMLLLPAAVVALAGLGRELRWPWAAALAAMALLVLQPDASQATTLAAAASLIALGSAGRPILRFGVIAVAAALTAVAWLRPDPLQPVAEVEQILGLAFEISPLLAGIAGLLLVAVANAPTFLARPASRDIRLAGAALGLCFLLWAGMPFLGAYPVPFVGIGMSPIVGAWLGVGLLAGLARTHRPGRFG